MIINATNQHQPHDQINTITNMIITTNKINTNKSCGLNKSIKLLRKPLWKKDFWSKMLVCV